MFHTVFGDHKLGDSSGNSFPSHKRDRQTDRQAHWTIVHLAQTVCDVQLCPLARQLQRRKDTARRRHVGAGWSCVEPMGKP